MTLFSIFKIIKTNYFSFLLALLPISFIAGNMIININAMLLVFSALIFFKKNVFKIKYFFIDKIILLFFFFILFNGIYADIKLYIYHNEFYETRNFATSIKSILFFRYFLLYLVLRFLVETNKIKLNLFFITCSLSSIFVCFDIFYQFTYGKDIFGFPVETTGRKFSGPFGDELIAGGYVQRFSFFSFFILPIFFPKYSNRFSKYLIPILFSIFVIGLTLSGNRMPTVLFIFIILLITVLQKQIRKFLIPFFLIFSVIFVVIYKSNDVVRFNFLGFYEQVVKISVSIKNKNFTDKHNPQHLKEFVTFYDTWLLNKYVGGGIKNFRYYCHVRPNNSIEYPDKKSKFICNMHPHNYYLEILTETGLVGFALILIIFFTAFSLTFVKKYFFASPLNQNNLIIPFIFLFIAEVFPIKSTGSFFTTGNTTYLFLILGILIALTRGKYSIENKV